MLLKANSFFCTVGYYRLTVATLVVCRMSQMPSYTVTCQKNWQFVPVRIVSPSRTDIMSADRQRFVTDWLTSSKCLTRNVECLPKVNWETSTSFSSNIGWSFGSHLFGQVMLVLVLLCYRAKLLQRLGIKNRLHCAINNTFANLEGVSQQHIS